MHDVFISYSFKNVKIADAICHHLENRSIRCWYAPRDVEPGTDWPSAIVNAIGKAKVFILVFSEESNTSDDVEKEIAQAIKNNCVIIPFRIDNSQLSDKLSYFLQNIHWLDAMSAPMEKSIEKLSNVVLKNIADDDSDAEASSDAEFFSDTELSGDGEISSDGGFSSDDGFSSDNEAFSDTELFSDDKPSSDKIRKIWTISIIISAVLLIFTILGCIISDKISNKETLPENAIAQFPLKQMDLDQENIYPFKSTYGFQGNVFFLQNRKTGNLSMAKSSTWEYIPGNTVIDLESEDISAVEIYKSEASDTVYFLDNHKVSVYDCEKSTWLNKEGFLLPLDPTELIYQSYAYTPDLISGNTNINDRIFIAFDPDKNNKCLTKIIYTTPSEVVSCIDISQLHIAEVVSEIDFEIENDLNPVLTWETTGKPIVFDLLSGKVLSTDYKDIYENYMPYTDDYNCISPNKKYITKLKTNQKDNKIYTNLEVWDMKKGERIFSDEIVGTNYSVFKDDNTLLLYKQNELFEIDLDNNKQKKLLDISYFNNTEAFDELPFGFTYLKKQNLCVWDTSYYNEDNEYRSKVVLTNLNGDVLYQSRGFKIPFQSYYSYTYAGDDFILHFFYSNEGTKIKSEDGTLPPYTLYSIPLRATYSYDSDGNIKFD